MPAGPVLYGSSDSKLLIVLRERIDCDFSGTADKHRDCRWIVNLEGRGQTS